MVEITGYEKLFYGGILIMGIAVLMVFMFLIIYIVRGAKLRHRLDEEYGEPQLYNRGNVRN